jgi:integrase
MYAGKLVFAQIMEPLPLHTFRRIVARYAGERKVKSFSCLDQFLCIAFEQLTFRESLRDIEACLRAQRSKLYYLGIRSTVSRNTLANAVRDGRIYADCAGPDRHRAPAVCRLTVRGRLEGVGLRPGYDHHRSVPVGIFVGAISAEVLTMRWDDVSLTRAEWRIPHTKAGRPHLLPLPHALVAMLRSLPSVD